jgi:hypothetical protein
MQALQSSVTDLSNKITTNMNNAPLTPSLVDESIPNIVYNGFAAPGAKATDAVWSIQKVTKILGITTYQWAGGTTTYTKIWNSRITLIYS